MFILFWPFGSFSDFFCPICFQCYFLIHILVMLPYVSDFLWLLRSVVWRFSVLFSDLLNIPEIWWKCLGSVKEMYRKSPGNVPQVQKKSRKNPKNIREMFRKRFRKFADISRMSWNFSDNCLRCRSLIRKCMLEICDISSRRKCTESMHNTKRFRPCVSCIILCFSLISPVCSRFPLHFWGNIQNLGEVHPSPPITLTV